MYNNKTIHRLASILLCAAMLLNIVPVPAFAENDSGAASIPALRKSIAELSMDISASVTLPPIAPAEEVAEPTFDHLYADESLVRGIDFSTKRLLVRTDDISIFTWDTNVLSEYDGVYLLQFDSEDAAMSAYTYYYGVADFVDPDVAVYVAEDRYIGATPADMVNTFDDPLARAGSLIAAWHSESRPHYSVALIDTGANGANDAASVIGTSSRDDNGHGGRMLSAMNEVAEDISVLSIKALDANGRGSVSGIYAAIECAVSADVDVICLPVAVKSALSLNVLNRAVRHARSAGITVVAAAGNNGADAGAYIPANISGVIAAGACDATGVRLPASNYGSGVFCNVTADSTSEAAAKLSAVIAAFGADYVNDILNEGLVFSTDYVPAEEPTEEEPSEEEPSEEEPSEEEPSEEEPSEEEPSEEEPSEEEPTEEEPAEEETVYAYGDEILPISDNTPPQQEPVTKDNVTIQKATARWLTTSDNETDPAGFDDLYLAPEGDSVKTQQFQLDFSLSGQSMFEPGTIQIEIPAYLWKDRDGNEYGDLTLSCPEAPDASADFVWTRVGDKIIITNNKQISAASKIMIQGSVRNMQAHQVVDETESEELSAKITVVTPEGNDLSMESNTIQAKLDTKVDASSASKTAYDPVDRDYSIWWESVPTDIPDELLAVLPEGNPEDYVYIRWYVQGMAKGNQPFEMTVTDTIDAEDAEKYGGIMLGVSDSAEGTVPSDDLKTVTAQMFDGYSEMAKTAYVWTAYPKSAFDKLSEEEKDSIVFNNSQTITVEGWDDEIETTKSASAEVPSKVPTDYHFVKIWDDDNNAAGKRPDRLGVDIYDESVSTTKPVDSVILTEADATTEDGNNWSYSWSDHGKKGYKPRVNEVLYNASGIYDDRFNPDGSNMQWSYRGSWKYESDTRTWIYTNTLNEGPGVSSSIYKVIDQKYNDPDVDSTRDLALNELMRGDDVLVPYYVHTRLASSATSVSGTKLGAVPNTYTLEDGVYKLEDEFMDIADVDVGAVSLDKSALALYRYRLNSFDPETGLYESDLVDPLPPITLYGWMDGAWKPMATLTNGATLRAEGGSGASVEGWRVNLPNGVEKIKLEMESEDAQVAILAYTIYLRIHPTDAVKAMIDQAFEKGDYIRFTLYNRADGYVTYSGEQDQTVNGIPVTHGQELVHLDANDIGYLHGRNYKVAADLSKTFEQMQQTQADISKKRVRLHSTITLTQQSNVLSKSEYLNAIELGEIPNTTSGIYFDLLPPDVDPDVNSIKLSNGDTVANVWTIPNYKDSGRTLLVVMVNETNNINFIAKKPDKYAGYDTYPESGYKNEHTMEFDAYASLEAIKEDDLQYMRNVVAYEADENRIGSFAAWSGEVDNPDGGNHMNSNNAVKDALDIMTGLDPNGRTDPSFVYAGAELKYDTVDVSAVSSLDKQVTADGSGYWTDGHQNDVNVQEGGRYTYRLQMSAATDTRSSNIILLDSLENYEPNSTDAGRGENNIGQWRGSLVSVDVSQLVRKGVQPVIYYSTVPNLNLSPSAINPKAEAGAVKNYLDTAVTGTGEKVWTTTAPSSLSSVTAFAIDCSMGTNGQPFVLDQNESLIAYVHMRAPYDETTDDPDYFNGTDGTKHERNFHAYNAVSMDCLDENLVDGSSNQDCIEFSYTKVGIYTKYFRVKKVWDDDNDVDGKRPTEITVWLDIDGEHVEGYDPIVLNEENGWEGQFKRVLTYDEDGNKIIYTYYEEFSQQNAYRDEYDLTVTRQDAGDYVQVTMTNTHVPEKITIPVTKEWAGEDNVDPELTRPGSVVVKLYANGVYTGRTLTIRPDAKGNWYGEFTDLNKYYDHGKEVQYTIEEEYVDDYITEQNVDAEGNPIITNTYYPYGDLRVQKTIEDTTDAASANNEFMFALRLTKWNEDEQKDEPLTNKYSYVIYDSNKKDEDGNDQAVSDGKIGDGDNFYLKDGQYIVIKDIPTHVDYTIVEAWRNAFTQSKVVGDNGEIRSGKPAEAEFTNKYTTAGSAELSVLKQLVDREGNPRNVSAYQFQFELEDEYGNVISVYNAADGSVSFPRLAYGNADNLKKFTYYLREVNAGKGGYTYDGTAYKVVVIPKDNGDGTMTCDVKYYDIEDVNEGNPLNPEQVGTDAEGKPIEAYVFNNEYNADGEITLRVWKTLEVYDLAEYKFDFELYEYTPGVGAELIAEAQNEADGNVVFDSIKFTEVNEGETHYYFVREKAGTDETIIYDNHIFFYSVTVIDNGDGTLSFDQKNYDVTELFACEDCLGTGEVANPAPADPANPDMLPCETCGGTGLKYELPNVPEGALCGTCNGAGEVANPDPAVPGMLTCADCNGVGITFQLAAGEWKLPANEELPVFNNKLEDGYLAISKYTEDGDPDQVFTFWLELTGAGVDDLDVSFERGNAAKSDYDWTDWYEEYGPPAASGEGDEPDTDDESGTQTASAAATARHVASVADAAARNDYAIAPIADADDHGAVKKTDLCGVNNSIKWTTYTDGTLVIEPADGLSSGTLPKINDTDSLAPWGEWQRSSDGYTVTLQNPEDFVHVEVKGTVYLNSEAELFQGGFTSLQTADMTGLSAQGTYNTAFMFNGCTSLETVKFGEGLAGGTLSNVQQMFSGCTSNLSEIDFGGIKAGTATASGTYTAFFRATTPYARLKKVKLGPSFYAGSSQKFILPPPVANNTYTGNWIQLDENGKAVGIGYSSADLITNWNSSMAGIWVWEKKVYTITFDPGEGQGTPETAEVNPSSDYNIPDFSTKFTRERFHQTGWLVEGSNPIETYEPEGVIPGNKYSSNDEITLVAQWEPDEVPIYTIVFDGGEGSLGAMQQQTSAPDAAFDIPASKFKRFGYIQTGWTVFVDGEEKGTYDLGAQILANTYKKDQVVKLVAIWKEDPDGGKVVDGLLKIEVHSGERVVIRSLPAGVTYKLWEETEAGWFLVDQSGDTGVIEPLETPEAFFYNLYREGLGRTSARLSGTKTLDGNPAANYVFELVDEVTGDVIGEATSDANGNFSFETIGYEAPEDEGEHKYIIREKNLGDPTINYDEDVSHVTVLVENDGDGNLTATVTYDAKRAKFVNTTKPGSLILMKNAGGNTNAEFIFRVRLLNSNGTPAVNYTIDGVGTTDDKGYIDVKVSEGKPVTFDGLAAGMKYEVEEISLPNGWSVNAPNGTNGTPGTINPNEQSQVTVTNTYSATGSIVLPAHKLFEGNTLTQGQFEFELVDADGNVLSKVSNTAPDTTEESVDDAGNSEKNPWYGWGSVTFGAITYTEADAGKTFTYTIREVKPADADPNIVYDDEEVTVTVEVKDNGDGTLSAVVKDITPVKDKDDGRGGVEFINTMDSGDLTVSKALRNATDAAKANAEFTFHVKVYDSEAMDVQLTGPFNVELPNGDEIWITDENDSVTIKGGESFTVYDLPHGSYYVVTEDEQNEKSAGFQLVASEGVDGTIEANDMKQASFTNVYTTKGEFIFTARKTLLGANLEDGMFRFELKNQNGQVIRTAYADANGNIKFDPVDFGVLDDGKEYVFFITESRAQDSDYYYDTHTETIYLTVKDNGDGTMTITPRYVEANGDANYEPTFINAALLNLEVTKLVNGDAADQAQEFTFTLTLENAMTTLPNVLSYSKDGVAGTLARTDGKYTFTLRHGETITFQGLPAGTTYTISESTSGYAAEGTVTAGGATVNFTGKTVQSGPMENDHSVAFTNTPKKWEVEKIASVGGIDIADGDFVRVGDTVVYTIKVTNTGDVPVTLKLRDIFKVDGTEKKLTNWNPQDWEEPFTLAVDGHKIFTAEYVVQDGDKNLHNYVEADDPDDPSTPPPSDETDNEVGRPHLSLVKRTTSKPKNGKKYVVGETIKYRITVTNDGNMTLTNAVVTDELTGAQWAIEKLEPGEKKTFTTSYVVKQADVTAGTVVNVAVAEADNPNYDPNNPNDPNHPPKVPGGPSEVKDPTGADTSGTSSPSGSGGSGSSGSSGSLPQTGDYSNLRLWLMLLIVSALGVLVTLRYMRKYASEAKGKRK